MTVPIAVEDYGIYAYDSYRRPQPDRLEERVGQRGERTLEVASSVARVRISSGDWLAARADSLIDASLSTSTGRPSCRRTCGSVGEDSEQPRLEVRAGLELIADRNAFKKVSWTILRSPRDGQTRPQRLSRWTRGLRELVPGVLGEGTRRTDGGRRKACQYPLDAPDRTPGRCGFIPISVRGEDTAAPAGDNGEPQGAGSRRPRRRPAPRPAQAPAGRRSGDAAVQKTFVTVTSEQSSFTPGFEKQARLLRRQACPLLVCLSRAPCASAQTHSAVLNKNRITFATSSGTYTTIMRDLILPELSHLERVARRGKRLPDGQRGSEARPRLQGPAHPL